MKHYSVKMSDGTRFDFDSDNGMKWLDDGTYLIIETKGTKIWLNALHIVSITISRYAHDS